MPQSNPVALEDANAFMRRVAALEIGRCPRCATGRWQPVRFTLTDNANPVNMPTFNFDCHDALLDLVAILTYLPFASESGWTYIRFR